MDSNDSRTEERRRSGSRSSKRDSPRARTHPSRRVTKAKHKVSKKRKAKYKRSRSSSSSSSQTDSRSEDDNDRKRSRRDSESKGIKRRRTSSSSSSSSSEPAKKRKKSSKSKRQHKSKKEKRSKESEKNGTQLNTVSKTAAKKESKEMIGPDPKMMQMHSMKPMTKEEWDQQQSVMRRVYDPDTGRHRLIKGDGEVMEEIVTYERHVEINKRATEGDAAAFQAKLGLQKKTLFDRTTKKSNK